VTGICYPVRMSFGQGFFLGVTPMNATKSLSFPRLLTTVQAAEILTIKDQTVRLWLSVDRHGLRSACGVRIGGRVRIDADKLREWMENQNRPNGNGTRRRRAN